MVHHPESDFGDTGGELAQLDAVELVHIHAGENGGNFVLLVAAQQLEHFDFQQAELAVGDYEKVSAAAGRIENLQGTELFVKSLDRLAATGVTALRELLKLSAKIIQEQRLNDLQDIFLGSVVRALRATLFLFHYGLEE